MKPATAILLGFCTVAAICLLRRKKNAPAIGGVSGVESAFEKFVERSLKNGQYNRRFKVYINERQRNIIKKILKKDITSFFIPAHAIRHAELHNLTKEDFGLFPTILNNGLVFPEIDTSKGNELGARFEMTFSGQTTNIIMISCVVNLEREDLEMKTAYKT